MEHPDEMEFGLGIQPELWILKGVFVAKWRAIAAQNGSAVAFVRLKSIKNLYSSKRRCD